jgi:hypothetical protein
MYIIHFIKIYIILIKASSLGGFFKIIEYKEKQKIMYINKKNKKIIFY